MQYMRKICTRSLPLRKIVLLSPLRNICTRFAQDLRKIVLLSPMRNICATFAQGCTYFPNAKHMRKICARSFPMRNICARSFPMRNICARSFPMRNICARSLSMCNICERLYLLPQRAMYVQDLRKNVLISPMCNICARFVQDCTYFSNAKYIFTRLYLFLQCAIFAQDCRHYWKKYVRYHKSALNLEWYLLHSYFWIATSFDFFLNKHL